MSQARSSTGTGAEGTWQTATGASPSEWTSEDILAAERENLCPGLLRDGPAWAKGSGAELVDADGRHYIDFTSGVLVTNTGHCHPKVVEAIRSQAGRLINCFTAPHEPRARLAAALADLLPSGLDTVAFFSSGSEAVEAAVKLVRHSTGHSVIVGFTGAFHGRTYMAMELGDPARYVATFGRGPTGVIHAPFPYPYRCPRARDRGHDCTEHCLAELDALLAEAGEAPAAMIIEPYLGAGGSIVAPAAFLQGLRTRCDGYRTLLILDEVQSGFGRTGTMFAFEQYGIVPDVIVLGKGIASGAPLTAVVAGRDAMSSLPPGALGSTYGGNPLSCAAALATIEVMKEERLPERAAALGEVMRSELNRVLAPCALVGDIRGVGLVYGIELVLDRKTQEPALWESGEVVRRAYGRGLALIPPIGVHGNVVRLAPPLVIEKDRLRAGIEALGMVVNEVASDRRGAGRKQ